MKRKAMSHNDVMMKVLKWAEHREMECIGIGACPVNERDGKPICAAAFRRTHRDSPYVVYHICIEPDGTLMPVYINKHNPVWVPCEKLGGPINVFFPHYLQTPEAAMDRLVQKAFVEEKAKLLGEGGQDGDEKPSL